MLAILLGAIIRTFWSPPISWIPGIEFSAKTLLEIAVTLLGASISAQDILQIGPALTAGIGIVVTGALVCGYGIGCVLGLSKKMALLVACGNSICGNSAIAAVAPVIGADAAEIAASIAFTAVLSVAVVIGLPLLIPLLKLSGLQYGVLAGLTVYAVPQVLAATMPVSKVALQIGTIVKLVRVLMLGPLLLILAMTGTKLCGPDRRALPDIPKRPAEITWLRIVPWFIIGFIALSIARSAGAIPSALLSPISLATTWFTTVSMAALGLGVDVRVALPSQRLSYDN